MNNQKEKENLTSKIFVALTLTLSLVCGTALLAGGASAQAETEGKTAGIQVPIQISQGNGSNNCRPNQTPPC